MKNTIDATTGLWVGSHAIGRAPSCYIAARPFMS